MNSNLDQIVAGTPIAAPVSPLGVPAHVIVFTRWMEFANSSTRRYRGEHLC